MAEPKRGSVEAFKAAEQRRQERIKRPSSSRADAKASRKESFNKKVASINKSRTDQGSVSKFKAAEERRQQRLAEVNKPKFGSPKMKRQRAQADVEKDLPKAKTTTGKIAGTSVAAMGKDRVGNRAGKVAAAGKTAKPEAAPKAEASTSKKSADLSGFGAAFKKARAEGVGTKFAYNDKMYSAVTRDDISRAGKSSLKEFLESSKRKATTKLAKAPGQREEAIVKKAKGGEISDTVKRRLKEAMERRNKTLKNRSGAAMSRSELERMREAMEGAEGRPDVRTMPGVPGRQREAKPMPMIPGQRPDARPMPMDPNMQREAKPMPMRPGERPEGKKYERPIGRPELKERPMRRSMDRFKSGGSVMARGCKMGRKKATKLY